MALLEKLGVLRSRKFLVGLGCGKAHRKATTTLVEALKSYREGAGSFMYIICAYLSYKYDVLIA